MSPRLARLLLAAGTALHAHTILRARRILADSLNLDGDADSGCGTSWCPCQVRLDDDEATVDTVCAVDFPVTGLTGDRCEKPTGHVGLHAGGGYMWTDGFGRAAA